MNPLMQEALASIARSVLKVGAGYLVARGVWSPDEATNYVGALALGLVGLGWSYWTVYSQRLKIVTALSAETKMSEDQLETKIHSGTTLPSTTTPKAHVPTHEPLRP
jgi:hypothetical protein